MPKNTDTKAQRRCGAVRGAVVHCLIQAASAGFLIWGAVAPGIPRWLCVALWVLAAPCIIMIPATLVVLKNRLNEIEGGEEDAAAQY